MRVLLILWFACNSITAFPQKKLTTFILIRHAEKVADGSKNPDLSEEGKKRAMNLVAIFKNTSIDAILSTTFLRTESTVKPLANAKSLEVKHYDALKTSVVDSLLRACKGKAIVLCGHSNTIPRIANYLTGTDSYKDFLDSDYGNIMIITVSPKRKDSAVTWLRF
jgi:broad specificity phosphatase PhoE